MGTQINFYRFDGANNLEKFSAAMAWLREHPNGELYIPRGIVSGNSITMSLQASTAIIRNRIYFVVIFLIRARLILTGRSVRM